MALTLGTRIGGYEILCAIGAGGMGEVYRARDTRLGRDVAIKTVPETASADPERMARLEREAQLLAALNHPHIGAIYGFEDGPAGRFLILELIDGESLAARLARARPDGLPLDETLRIARQIIDALEAAHDKGIIHRDLKPANVMLTADGDVKVLDFGLARAADPASAVSVSNSPTLSLAATQQGMILGTAAYMSPEQAKGRVADKRSDVWSFGCVLYEMLTGRQPFEGEDVSDILAGILRGEPDWSAFPATVPEQIRTIVRRCLERDRKARIPDVAVVRYLLDEPARSPAPVPAQPAASPSRPRQLALAGSGLAGGLVIAAIVWWTAGRAAAPSPAAPVRFSIQPSADHALIHSPIDRTVVVSPDGGHIVYVGRGPAGDSHLMLRRVGELQSTAIANTAGARYPFFSPDGRWVGYFGSGELKKVAIGGGSPSVVCRTSGGTRGSVWTERNQIVYATNDPTTGLMIVDANGGEPRPLTKVQAAEDHFHPSLLPGHRDVLFTVYKTSMSESPQIAVANIETGEHRVVLRGGMQPAYARTGHLIYAMAGTLRASRFDLSRLEVVGDPAVIEQGVLTLGTSAAANYAVSDNGLLVFTPGSESSTQRKLVWVYRDGREEAIDLEPRVYTAVRISPDGNRAALEIRDQDQDIWVVDFTRLTPSRLTFEPALDASPVWTPDGRHIIFQSARSGTPSLFRQAADGTGAVERLTTNTVTIQMPYSLTPDGSQLVMGEVRPGTGPDLMLLRFDRESAPQPLISTTFNDANAELSPDGRWIAYQNNENGAPHIYVRPFPNVEGGRWQVSPTAGSRPMWSRATREIFYAEPVSGAMIGVPYDVTGGVFRAGIPARILDSRSTMAIVGRPYDVSPDAKRFLMIKDPDGDTSAPAMPIVAVVNWFEELKAKLPEK